MTEMQLLRLPHVLNKTGLSRSNLYAKISRGDFPRPIPLGSPHAVGWLASEIETWIGAQVRAARPEPAEHVAA